MGTRLDSLRTLDQVRYVIDRLREADRLEAFAQCGFDDNQSLSDDIFRNRGLAWVASFNDVPVALVGANELWPGVWSAWMLATEDFPKVGMFVTKFIKRAMIPQLNDRGAHRCEARSDARHLEAHAWLESLGAVKEAELKRYGRGGEDFFIYRWDRN